MELVVDELHPGTDERTWFAGGTLAALQPLCLTRPRRLVVVAPHPDDEVLGAGGLLQQMSRVGVAITVVAVTDGEASQAATAPALRIDLGKRRSIETRVALDRLGCRSVNVRRLHLPDGAVVNHAADLTDVLCNLLMPDDLCLTTWRSDGHPDHEATGHATVDAARSVGATVLEFPIWAWHWATPTGAGPPWTRCRRWDLNARQRARKRWATYAYSSQIRGAEECDEPGPVLPDHVLRRFWRPFEVFIGAEP